MKKEIQFHGIALAKAGKNFKRGLLPLAIAGAAVLFCGCISVHVHKDEDQPPPVIVVPNDHPNP